MDETSDGIFEHAVAPPRRPPARDRPAISRPMLFVALAFIAGLALGRQWLLPAWSLAASAGLIALASALSLLLARRREENSAPAGYLLLVALMFLGWAHSNRALRQDEQAAVIARRFEQEKLLRVEGRVADLPVCRGASLQMVIDQARVFSVNGNEAGTPFPLGVLIRTSATTLGVAATDRTEPEECGALPVQGERVTAWGRLRAPESRVTSGDFDYAANLRGRGIGAILQLTSINDLDIPSDQKGWALGFFRAVDAIRGAVRSRLRSALPAPQAQMALALLIGDRNFLTPKERDDFVRTGLAHILSVSGLHTSFILALALFFLRLLGCSPRVGAVVGALTLAGYLVLTGFQPPVVRAAVMGVFLLGGWALGRTTSIIAALATSAFLTLAFDPRNLIRADWQLSYLCVASLALFGPVIYETVFDPDLRRGDLNPDDQRRRWLKSAAMKGIGFPLTAVLAVQIGLLPLQLYLFHQFSIVGLFVQAAAGLLAFMIMGGAILISVLGGIAPVSDGLGFLVSQVITLFQGLVEWTASFRWASIALHAMPVWLVGAYYGVMLLGPQLRRGEGFEQRFSRGQKLHVARRGIFAAAVLFVLFIVGHWGRGLLPPGDAGFEEGARLLDFYVVDVGQGDALVLKFPGGRIAVIDGGREWPHSASPPPILRFLSSMGVKDVDFVVATHADADHIGGLVPILETLNVREFIRGPDESPSEEYHRLLQALKEHNIPVRQARAGESLGDFEGVRIEVLNPDDTQDNNDASVTLLVDYDEIQMLLTGDISKAAEDRIIERGLARDIEVLKIPHHGSPGSTSEEFLDAFTPEIALISVGRHNVYHHPSRQVLDRLAAHHILTERTDEMGTLLLRTDGHKMRLYHDGGGSPAQIPAD